MRKLIWRVPAALGCLVALLLLLPWAFSNALLRAPAKAELEARTGLSIQRLGTATIAFLPTPHLEFKHLQLRDKAGRWRVEAETVEAELRLFALLQGRFELKSLTLLQPALVVDLDTRPFGQTSVIATALRLAEGAPAESGTEATPLGTLRVVGGTMRVNGRGVRPGTDIRDIDATLVWPAIGLAADLSGAASWSGHLGSFEVTAADPIALLRGLATTTTLRLRSDVANLDAAGSFAAAPRERFTGFLRATTASLREVRRLAGSGFVLPFPVEAASLEGTGTLSAGKLWLTNAKVGLDANAFEGAIALSLVDRIISLSGTLATDVLKLDALAAALPRLRDAAGGWSSEPIDFVALASREIDLRISAARVKLGAVELEDAALSVLLKNGRLDVALADARGYGGTVRLHAVGNFDAASLNFKLDGSFANIDLVSLFAVSPRRWISGNASGTLALANVGDSPAAILGGVAGHARVDVETGELIGIDLERVLRRVVKRPLLAAFELRSGHTAFDRLALDLDVADGVATVREGTTTGPSTRVVFSGWASVPDRSLDVRALATQSGSAEDATQMAPRFAFLIAGSWDAPSIEPDIARMRHRSGAVDTPTLFAAAEVRFLERSVLPRFAW